MNSMLGQLAEMPIWVQALAVPMILGHAAVLAFFVRSVLSHVLGVERYPWGDAPED